MTPSDDLVKQYRCAGYGLPELEQRRLQSIVGSPQHTAAIRLITEKQTALSLSKSGEEDVRQDEVIRIARGAHRLAKWSIFMAVLALIISIARNFLR